MSVSVKINGIERLQKKLEQISTQDLKPGVTKATGIVETAAKRLCPVKNGDLRRSIHMKVEENGQEVKGTVYTNMEYAPYVEFGTGRKGQGTYPYQVDGLTLEYRQTNWAYYPELDQVDDNVWTIDENSLIWTSGQVAQPYMYPALEWNKDRCNKAVADAIRKKIKELAK